MDKKGDVSKYMRGWCSVRGSSFTLRWTEVIGLVSDKLLTCFGESSATRHEYPNNKNLERMSEQEIVSPTYWLTTEWYLDDM